MNEIEVLRCKIELKQQYINLLLDARDKTFTEIRALQDELAELRKPVNKRSRLPDWPEGVCNFIEDPNICDDFGEPKGQCVCGYDKAEHRSTPATFRENVIKNIPLKMEFKP